MTQSKKSHKLFIQKIINSWHLLTVCLQVFAYTLACTRVMQEFYTVLNKVCIGKTLYTRWKKNVCLYCILRLYNKMKWISLCMDEFTISFYHLMNFLDSYGYIYRISEFYPLATYNDECLKWEFLIFQENNE